MSIEDMWDTLIEEYGVSEETLQIVTDIIGYSEDALETVLYAVAGLNSFEEEEEEQEEQED